MKKVRWGLPIVAGVLVILAGALRGWIKLAEIRGDARMRERIEELRRSGECGARTRIPRGTPVPGRAWDSYRAALAAAVPSAEDAAGEGLPPGDPREEGPPGVAEAAHLAFARGYVARYGKALDLLARGARSAELGAPEGTGRRWKPLAEDLVTLAQYRMDVLLKERRAREGVEALLDLFRFYMDCEESGIPNSDFRREWRNVFSCFAHALESATMMPSEWADLEEQLSVLDRGAPCCLLESRRRLVDLGLSVLEPPKNPPLIHFRQWRYLYSETLLYQATFFRTDEGFRILEPLHEGDYAVLSRRADEICQGFKDSSNPVLSLYGALGGPIGDLSFSFRERHAEIRLLRVAAAYRSRGELPELADPTGTTLHHAIDEDHVELWATHGAKLKLQR